MEYGEKVLKYKNRIVFGKLSMPYFDRLPKEYYENEACFVFVNEGEVSVRSQESIMHLDKRKGLLAKCLNYFFETNDEQKKGGEGIEVIGILLYPSLVKELFEFDVTSSSFTVDFNLKQIQIDRLLENFRESIHILIDNPELADENIIKTKLKEFVLLISKSQEAPSQLDFLAALFKPTEVAFKKIIHTNLYANLSLDELASLCHLSTSSFKRKFKDTFGESPRKYIVKKKVEKAAEFLKARDLRISDIAYEVGFDSLATFNRNFSHTFEKSPSQYRLDLFDKPLS